MNHTLWTAVRAYVKAEKDHDRERRKADAEADAMEAGGGEYDWDAWVDRWWTPWHDARKALCGLVLLMHGLSPDAKVRMPIAMRFGHLLAVVGPDQDENGNALHVVDVRKAVEVPAPAGRRR